jgi:hypothetical protein
LAEFYSVQPCIADAAAEEGAEGGEGGEGEDAAAEQRRRQREWTVRHVILPALK